MPPAPAGSPQQAMMAQYTYLYGLAERLNLAQEQIEAQAAAPAAAAVREQAQAQYQSLKALVIRTADTVQAEMTRITAELKGSYVAQSDFGTYVQQLSSYLEANPEALTQYYRFAAALQAEVGRVDAGFRGWQAETEAYIRTGIVDYDGETPVYGVAVGQNLTATEIDGERVIDRRNFRATFTARRLSFWQDETEVAYISDNQLSICGIRVLGDMAVGPWRITAANGLAIQWGG